MRLALRAGGVLVLCLYSWAVVLAVDSAAADEGSGWVAGVQPDRRPENAPVIRKFQIPGDWYDQALKGIEQPYPYSLRLLEDQGGWYTPFNRPGMTGRYDIRGLHQR